MTNSFKVTLPLINTNEPEAILASLLIENKQWVDQDTLLCVLETTKSTFDLTAEVSGYVAGLNLKQGDLVRAGEVLCILVQSLDEIDQETTQEVLQAANNQGDSYGQSLAGLRITQPARKLAEQHLLDLASLPHDRLLTREDIQKILDQKDSPTLAEDNLKIDPVAVLLYGGGGHAKMLIDLIREARTYHIIGILDDQIKPGTEIMGVPVLGGDGELNRLYQEGVRLAVNAVGGIGNIMARINVFNKLIQAGYVLPPLIHPSAIVERSALISPGAQVFARAYVGGEAHVGFGAIVSTGSILSHDCILEEYAIVSPGAILAGEVHIGAGALIGMGVTINMRVLIGNRSRIGNNATINSDVQPKTIVQSGIVFNG